MVELTPLIEEAANLRSWVAEARRDADKAKKAFEALSVRSWKDDKEATRVRKEQDKLLQKDAETASGSLTFWVRLRKKGI